MVERTVGRTEKNPDGRIFDGKFSDGKFSDGQTDGPQQKKEVFNEAQRKLCQNVLWVEEETFGVMTIVLKLCWEPRCTS